ncbi:NUDIX domain-containing protein [Tissierella sp. MSJ-40]|uniref:NUDIX domain-containing protein n=1 Tax=Tissierella simiarum TaxID=2841534 RepID=A0ABS6E7Z0_9FIRM|nr:NUDIX domain-containing protein [Tissierella simiarum]MBU5439037.1 NUDIX domain-containing protein [Tissierella simiarum]
MDITEGAFVVIFNEEKRILLVRRRDFPIWDLPGGRLEKNEIIEECAIRETEEETGYMVVVEKKTGEYYRPQFSDRQHIFIAKIVDGKPRDKSDETSALRWFSVSNLPILMVPHRREQIKDSISQEHLVKKILNESRIILWLRKMKN